MIGYMIEQELGNLLPFEVPFATILTMVEVDRDDPGFSNPTKFIGPVYSESDAERLKTEKGWAMKQDGDKWRKVVPSPQPKQIFEVRPIRWLLERGTIVIAAGGGGIPTVYEPGRKLRGIEAVIDKDLCSELLARQLDVDFFVMATDTDAVFLDWGKPTAKAFRRASPAAMRDYSFPAGSMGPKAPRTGRDHTPIGSTAATISGSQPKRMSASGSSLISESIIHSTRNGAPRDSRFMPVCIIPTSHGSPSKIRSSAPARSIWSPRSRPITATRTPAAKPLAWE
jgi:carbamate kinase